MASFSQFGNDLYTGRRQIDFIGRRRRWYALTALLLLVALGGVLLKGLNFSLEFRGGSEIRVPAVTDTHDYEARAEQAVHRATGTSGDVNVTRLGGGIRIQTQKLGNGQASSTDAVSAALAQEFKVPQKSITTTYVGPSWGETVTHKAIVALAVFLALLSVLLAVYFRTWTMALAGIVAVVHDLAFTLGIYALSGFEISPATMIGFLTILGYSIYDTVVVFDKVRENTEESFVRGDRTYGQAANHAVNQTLVRSINTSVVALLPIAAILVVGFTLLGPGTLLDLALVLFIGVAVGTFSSIFIATPMLVDLRRRDRRVRELDRRARAHQARLAESMPADAEHTPGESASGVVLPETVQAAAATSGGRRRRRDIHPLARRED